MCAECEPELWPELKSSAFDNHNNNEEIPKVHEGYSMEHLSVHAHLLCNLNLLFQEKCP